MDETVVVTGGTTGLGRAVVLDRLGRGQRVIAVGRDPGRLAELETTARDARLHTLAADLSLVSETCRTVDEIRRLTSRVDALVLCARHYRSARSETGEGFESTFALFYLSRFLLSHEMLDLLAAAPRPVILNVAGPGTADADVRWDDLGGENGYSGGWALAQGGRLNDLLGVGFARRGTAPAVSYVLLHPGVVDTALSGDYDEHDAARVAAMRSGARTVGQAVPPLLEVLDDPPDAPLTALRDGVPLDLAATAEPHLADRLFALTTTLLARFTPAAPGVDRARLHRLLTTPVFATVATLGPDGGPHQSVVWVDLDGEDVVFTVAAGSVKERNLLRDPRASVLVGPPSEPYTHAAVRGTATLVPDPDGELLDRLSRKYTGREHADHHVEAAARRTAMVAVRVRPDRITGRL